MLAFQIHINGKPYCESDDITVVTMVAEDQQLVAFARAVRRVGERKEVPEMRAAPMTLDYRVRRRWKK